MGSIITENAPDQTTFTSKVEHGFSRKDAKNAKKCTFSGSNTKIRAFLCDLGVLGERKILAVKTVSKPGH
jgi:hypothetical protein